MKNVTLILSILFINLVSAGGALACRCMPNGPLTQEELTNAAAIFTGKVVRVAEDKQTYTTTITIEVSKAFKNVKKGERIEVRTSSSSASCGLHVELGEEWFMFVNAGDDGYRVGMCDRTIKLSMDQSVKGTEYEDMEKENLKARKKEYKEARRFICKHG